MKSFHALLTLGLIPAVTLAAPVDGYSGVKFGTPVANVMKSAPCTLNPLPMFTTGLEVFECEDLTVGPHTVSATWMFVNGRFGRVAIDLPWGELLSFSQTLKDKYGVTNGSTEAEFAAVEQQPSKEAYLAFADSSVYITMSSNERSQTSASLTYTDLNFDELLERAHVMHSEVADEELLKKRFYDENNISKYSATFNQNDIYAVEADMNADGVKEVGLVYGPFCGAGAYTCYWSIYSLVNGEYCNIGSLANESLSSVKNEPRVYRCRTQDNKLSLDEYGNQITENKIKGIQPAQNSVSDQQQEADAPIIADKPPFKFAIDGVKNSWRWYSITSEINELKIDGFTVNRNAKNCESFLWSNANRVVAGKEESKFEPVLGFGETAVYLVSDMCSAIEISVKANDNEWIYTEG